MRDITRKVNFGATFEIALDEITQEIAYFARALTGIPLEIKAVEYDQQAYFDGKTDEEIWEILQSHQAVFDYYDFRKRPSEQLE